MRLSDFSVNEKETILAAIEAIENNHQRNILVENDEKKIVGILSQGDIIRSIISGVSVYSQCGKIANSSFIFFNEKNMSKAYELFKSKNVTFIPVINEQFFLTDIITLHSIYEYIETR